MATATPSMLAQQLASMPLVVVPVPAPLAADRARSGAPIAAPPAGASPQRRAKEASCDSTAAAGAAAAPGGSPLLSLPADVTRAVLSRLLPADCAALRLSCRAGRAAAAPRVSRAALLERDLEAAAKLPLAALFPDLNEVRITLDGSSRADGSSSDDDDGVTRPVGAWRSPSAAQLPGRFAGSCTLAGGGGGAQRRGAGRGAVEARAAAVLERCVPEALQLSVFTGACGTRVTDVAALLAPPGTRRLSRLWVRAPQMHEPALVAVGRLTTLKDLSLASSGGITTCHLTRLSALTHLRMTVAAPLAPALAPLGALRALRALHLRCISPCGSWGAALRPVLEATAGRLTQLQLNFASLDEADFECFAAAEGLRLLDLTSCRHLTAGCIRHLSALTALTSLRLEHTGLILAHPQLQLLGSCTSLVELSCDSLDLNALRQEEERAQALAAAAAAPPAPAAPRGILGAARPPLPAAADMPPPAAGPGWPPLERVHLHSTSSYLNLRSLLRSAGLLRHLTLMHYVRWDEAIGLISSHGAALESLHISGFSGLTAAGFAQIASMPRLTRLVFRNAWLSADRVAPLAPPAQPPAPASFADAFPEAGAAPPPPPPPPPSASASSDAAEKAAGGGAARLWSLSLEHCTGADAATARVLAALPALERLLVHDCPDLTEEALLEFAASPRLSRIEVLNCARVGAGARPALRRAREAAAAGAAARACGGAAAEAGVPGMGAANEAAPALLGPIDMVWDGGSTSGDAGSCAAGSGGGSAGSGADAPATRGQPAGGRGRSRSASAPGASPTALRGRFSRRRAPPQAPQQQQERPPQQEQDGPAAAPDGPTGADPGWFLGPASTSDGAAASSASRPVERAASSAATAGARAGFAASSSGGERASSSSAGGASSSSSGSGGGGGGGGEVAGTVADEIARLTEAQMQQLNDYLDYMLEINRSMNLTAIRERGEAWGRHIEDSLALLPVIERHCPGACATSTGGGGGDSVGGRGAGGGGGAFSVIDVGSGAGLPGMVLAIARPQWRVTLLDTLKKRCAFLEAAAARAGARNVSVVWARAEEGGRRADLREGFDLSVARAVADTRVLAELCMPFVRPGGRWVAAKGADPGAEVRAAARAVRLLGGGEALQIVGVDSWAPEGQRTALVVEKAARTPDLYPRPPGSPNKKPL